MVREVDNHLTNDLKHILTHTDHLWDELRDQKIFITGGTGFFGCWLLESFMWANENLDLNATALVLTRSRDTFRKKAPHLVSNPAIQFYEGDVRSFRFPEGSFSYIIHAATSASLQLNEQNPLLMFDTIVQGTRHVLDFARHCNVRKFLFTSSGAVYGKQPSEMTNVSEDYTGAVNPVDPRSAYGEGKRAAELLCSLYSSQNDFEVKIARCFAFVGPYLPLDIHYAIGNFIRDGLKGEPICVKGDGTPYRSYLYAADLIIWLWTILFNGISCRPYNVGSGQGITIQKLAMIVADQFDHKPEIQILQKPQQNKTPERYVPSVQRAEIELGLKQLIDLPDAIRRTVNWNLNFT
ncbi:MAG: NAD-dependent epimerase/dehydratase family protein [Syntrophaceae bacterium]